MVKANLRSGTLRDEFESRNGIDTRIPIARAPCLYDELTWHQLDIAPGNVSAEKRESAPGFRADFCGRASKMHGLHSSAQLCNLVELLGIHERLVDALRTRLESGLLVNSLCGMGNSVLGRGPRIR
jgi:hypothetical protein